MLRPIIKNTITIAFKFILWFFIFQRIWHQSMSHAFFSSRYVTCMDFHQCSNIDCGSKKTLIHRKRSHAPTPYHTWHVKSYTDSLQNHIVRASYALLSLDEKDNLCVHVNKVLQEVRQGCIWMWQLLHSGNLMHQCRIARYHSFYVQFWTHLLHVWHMGYRRSSEFQFTCFFSNIYHLNISHISDILFFFFWPK